MVDDSLLDPSREEGPSTQMRVAFALLAGVLAGVLLVTARAEPAAEQPRVSERIELAELIRSEQGRAEELAQRVEELSAEIEALEQSLPADEDARAALQDRIDEVAAPAGMTAVRGPGVVAALTDSSLSPEDVDDPNDLVIHEQDLHAVINALWAGGAEAMSVNGQRILSTSAVRCVGSVLLLHGRQYSPPYVIRAVGDDVALQDALERDPGVQVFSENVTEHRLGFDVEAREEQVLPPYEGTAGLQVARPAEGF
jgi:uncharacterized protein YlxW (UPF0749 family)